MMTDVEYVQLLIGDTGAVIFTVVHIAEFLSRNGDDVYLAAADACFAIAMDSKLLDKAERMGNYSLDRKGIVKNMHDMAKQYRETATSTPAYGFFEQAHTDMTAREIIDKEAMRGND